MSTLAERILGAAAGEYVDRKVDRAYVHDGTGVLTLETWKQMGAERLSELPQLYVLFSMGRVNAEFWNMYYFPLNGDDQFYIGRLLVNVRLFGGLALGPHMEWTWVQNKGQDRLAFGGDLLNTFRWGQVGLYVGWDRKNETPEFRLTFQKEL